MKAKTKKLIITFVCAALAVAIGVVAIVAVLNKQADGSSNNTFAAGMIDCTVLITNNDYTVRNDGNAPAYIRAAIAVNWKNANGQYLGTSTTTTFTPANANWVQGSDGFYYFTEKVASGASTSVLVNSATIQSLNQNGPSGATLEITVIAEAIQATLGTYTAAWQFASTNGSIAPVERPTEAPTQSPEEEGTTDPSTHVHDYSYLPAGCENAATCECGQTMGGVLGHIVVADAAVAATCTTTGWTEGSHCSRCSKIITPQTETPVDTTAHDIVGATCSRCGYEIEDVALDLTQSSPYEMYRACSCGYVDGSDGTSIVSTPSIDSFQCQDGNATNYNAQLLAGKVTLGSHTSPYFNISGWVGLNASSVTFYIKYGSDGELNNWSMLSASTTEPEVYTAAASLGYTNASRFICTFHTDNFKSGETVHLLVKDNSSGIMYCFADFMVIKNGERAQTVIGSIDNFNHQTTGTEYATAEFKASPSKYTVTIAETNGLFDIRGWIATNLTDFSFVWRINEEYREGSVIKESTEEDVQNAAVASGYTTGQRFHYYFGPELINSGDTIYLYTKDNTTGELYLFASYTIKMTASAAKFNRLTNLVAFDDFIKGQATTQNGSIALWFDHMTEKRDRYDVPSSTYINANSSYTIQMAKNEIEGCHFYLHSELNKNVIIEYTPFTDANGNVLETELGVEFYIEEGYITTNGYTIGQTSATGNKVGVYPDAVIPYESYIKSGYGDDEGGSYEYGTWVPIGPYSYKSWDLANYPYKDALRGFVLQATTTKGSAAGLYSATITIKEFGTENVLKTATVYTYVYDVTLNDEPALDTYIGMWYTQYEAVNNLFGINTSDAVVALADFMLEYRLTPVWSGWFYDNYFGTEWLYNPRVTTVRVASQTYYERWKDDPIISKKMVYYGQDEPCAPRNQYRTITFEEGNTADYFDVYGFLALLGVAEEAKMLQNTWGWTDYRLVAPLERNPDFTDLKNYPSLDKSGVMNISWSTVYAALQEAGAQNLYNEYKTELESSKDMFEFLSNYLTVWVYTYTGSTPKVLDTTGCYYMQSVAHDALYGEFYERMRKYQASGDEIWAYVACEPQWHTPYQNILLFNDGTEARTMFWTCYKLGQTGFLYWREDYYTNTSNANTYNMRNPFSATGPGDGILVYPGGIYGQVDPIPSIRLINMRDGVEDYELLCMLEDKYNREGYGGYASAREKIMDVVENIVTSTVTFSRDDTELYNVHAYILSELAK